MRKILASASPRRRELLSQLDWEFTVQVSEVEETITRSLPGEIVEELSALKAEAVFRQTADDVLVIGADTVVANKDKILGKPADETEAADMIRSLQGGSHEVYTGVTLCVRQNGIERRKSFHECTKVTFYPMTQEEINWYIYHGEAVDKTNGRLWNTHNGHQPEWYDKAGAYGIQGIAGRFVQGIEGDYNNVVGLPVARLYQEWKKMQKRLVIFDLDGTLLDTIASLKYCGDHALKTVGLGPFEPQDYKYFVGEGAVRLVEKALIAAGDKTLSHFDQVYDAYREVFRDNCMYEVKPYEGIPELLKALQQRGIRLAVLSNKPHQETIAVVESFFGKDCFDWIQGQKPDVERKPSPEGVYQIVEGLSVGMEEVLYVGDTGTDMQTGKSAGAFTVGVLWGFRDRNELEENNADVIIENPLQILDYID